MTLSALLLYAAVYFAAVATPGPGVAALVARVIAWGLVGVAPFILGFVVGDLIWLTVAATGLALVARSFATLFSVIKIAGAAYLIYVAWGLARTRSTAEASAPPRPAPGAGRTFLGALALTLGNPKVIVFFLSIMPLAVDLAQLTLARFALLAFISVVILSATLFSYALAAHQARAWMRSSRAMNIARKTAAGVMAGVALAIVTR
jgi:threonine/homoserine/homoserine lactone efflux protein